MASSLFSCRQLLQGQPALVIEHSALDEGGIISKARAKKLSPRTISKIRSLDICKERWELSKPTIYVMHAAEMQIYLARDMQQAHYQIQRHKIKQIKNGVCSVRKKCGKQCGVRIIEIVRSVSEYRDDYLIVLNNPRSSALAELDKQTIETKLANIKVSDPCRNSTCIDLGFAGTHNSRRESKYLGITHSNLHALTREQWAKEVFRVTTAVLDDVFNDMKGDIYSDNQRNALWASEIETSNRCEAIRLGRTNKTSSMLKIHWDNGNCSSPQYGWVATISWWTRDSVKNGLARHAITTYGKQCASEYMDARTKHSRSILLLERVFNVLPQEQKGRSMSMFPTMGDRSEFDFPFLDKGIFYSLFVSAISQVFNCYPILRGNLLMACAFVVNVVMSECPDHFWHICRELMADKKAVGSVAIDNCDPVQFGYALACEIFKRKRHSGNALPEKDVAYKTKQRHAPAVNRPPTKLQIKQSIHALALLARELRLRVQWNTANALHYYGRATEFLVEECFGAGHLTAQQIIGVGSGISMLPNEFLDVAEVGVTTRTWTFLRWAFGYEENIAYAQTNVLLRACSVYLGISILQVEELCCYACKLLSPRRQGYELTPCTIDFATCTLDLTRANRFGDVIYRSMKLYYMGESGVLQTLDSNGVVRNATPVLHRSLFTAVKHVPVPGFWKRKPQSNRTFHYRRTASRVSVTDLREYFISSDPEQYVPRGNNTRRWSTAGDYAADYVASTLPQPNFEAVLLRFDAREPLNLRQLTWIAVNGRGSFSAKLFEVRACSLNLFRPPCVSKEFRYMKRAGFYSIGIRMPSTTQLPNERCVFWPDPYFDMYTCGRSAPRCKGPWKSATSGYRDEQCYPWNYSRVVSNTASCSCRRWFNSRRDAEEFALWDFFFRNIGKFDLSNPQVRSLLFLEGTTRGPYARSKMAAARIMVESTDDVHVYFNGPSHRSTTVRTPYAIAVKYPRGGMAFWRCNEFGQRITGAFLRRPALKCRQAKGCQTMYELLSILGHCSKDERRVKFKKSPVNLHVKWMSGEITEEPMTIIFEDSPMEVLMYGRRMGLLDKPGWARVRRFGLDVDARKNRETCRRRVHTRDCPPPLEGLEDGEIHENVPKPTRPVNNPLIPDRTCGVMPRSCLRRHTDQEVNAQRHSKRVRFS